MTNIISDSEFNPDDWQIVEERIDDGGSYNVEQINGVRRTQHTHNNTSQIWLIHLYQAASYTPATQGSIYFINYEELTQATGSPPVMG